MKIIFVVPSSQWLTSAGVRIRYQRLEPFFKINDCTVNIIPIQDVSESYLRCADVVILSKVFSTDSIHIMTLCRNFGVKIGIDLFDDYFSDNRLSVFRRFHDWLELTSQIIDFIICSTDRMKSIASQYFNPQLIHKINDTKDASITFSETKRLLDAKIVELSAKNHLNILWFGMGDNPYFNVGISDLSNYSNALFQIKKLTNSINFTILTNERALNAKNLTRISRLPIQSKLEIWSECKEKNYLRESHLAFMPVSHQNFSVAKSPNRCLTALSYGCQILSNGFDLYHDFSEFIYKNTRNWSEDYKNSTFRFSSDKMSSFEDICKKLYDPEVEVLKFLHFLRLNVLANVSNELAKLCIVNTKPYSSNLPYSPLNSSILVINGSNLSITASSNFGIEKYGKTRYFAFTNSSQNLLLEKWQKYLETLTPKISEPNKHIMHYALCIDTVQEIIPESKGDLERIITVRYMKKNDNEALESMQREIYQSLYASPLKNIVRILFGSVHLFFADCHNKVHPFKSSI